LLGFDRDTPIVTGGDEHGHGVAGLFVRLLAPTDTEVRVVKLFAAGDRPQDGA